MIDAFIIAIHQNKERLTSVVLERQLRGCSVIRAFAAADVFLDTSLEACLNHLLIRVEKQSGVMIRTVIFQGDEEMGAIIEGLLRKVPICVTTTNHSVADATELARWWAEQADKG